MQFLVVQLDLALDLYNRISLEFLMEFFKGKSLEIDIENLCKKLKDFFGK